MDNFRILLVGDEPRITKFLIIRLKASSYEVLTANDGSEALEQIEAQEPDLVVLDVVVPGVDGFEILKQIREISSVPVIFLSAKEESTKIVKALQLGADDYLVKPFNPYELVARIAAIKRRLTLSHDRIDLDHIILGDMTVDQRNHLVIINGKQVVLTKIEWRMISELSRDAGKILTDKELLTRIWGHERRDDIQLLRTWVSRLRNKIEKVSGNKHIIRNIRKTGYIIDLPATNYEPG